MFQLKKPQLLPSSLTEHWLVQYDDIQAWLLLLAGYEINRGGETGDDIFSSSFLVRKKEIENCKDLLTGECG